MVSISNNIIACMICFLCSGCQKRDLSRVCKEVQASCLSDQEYISFFDEDLHEFACADESGQQGVDSPEVPESAISQENSP